MSAAKSHPKSASSARQPAPAKPAAVVHRRSCAVEPPREAWAAPKAPSCIQEQNHRIGIGSGAGSTSHPAPAQTRSLGTAARARGRYRGIGVDTWTHPHHRFHLARTDHQEGARQRPRCGVGERQTRSSPQGCSSARPSQSGRWRRARQSQSHARLAHASAGLPQGG